MHCRGNNNSSVVALKQCSVIANMADMEAVCICFSSRKADDDVAEGEGSAQ